jgi:hypothetical protein
VSIWGVLCIVGVLLFMAGALICWALVAINRDEDEILRPWITQDRHKTKETNGKSE